LFVVAHLRFTACWQSGNLHYMVGHGRLLEVLYIIGLGDSRVPETKNMVLPTNWNQHRRLWRNLKVWYLRYANGKTDKHGALHTRYNRNTSHGACKAKS